MTSIGKGGEAIRLQEEKVMEISEDLKRALEMTSAFSNDSQTKRVCLDRHDTMYLEREKYISVRGVVCNFHELQQQPYSSTSLTGMNKVILISEKASR